MNWIDCHRNIDEGVTVGNCRMNRLLFADELTLNAWIFGTKSSAHIDRFLLHATKERKSALKRLRYYVSPRQCFLGRRSRQCFLQVSTNTLQQVETFKYHLGDGVVFTSDVSRNKRIDARIGKANAVLRELYCSVVTKQGLSNNANFSVFKSVFVPILTCGHGS